MNISFFLGANSVRGFCSLYDGFPADKGSRLHIIKSGPGTGKSGFMRAIGRAAEDSGLDAQYVLCSGDPDSLDGVYIPALHEAWVDGTAPHVIEPRHFGVDSDYVNLGVFCSAPFSEAEAERAALLTASYRADYTGAYAYLRALGDMGRAAAPASMGGRRCEELGVLLRELICGRETRQDAVIPACGSFFLSAVSCQGMVRLNSTVSKICSLVYTLGGMAGGDEALELAAREARSLGLRPLVCPSPMEPERPEAVLLPELSLGFVRDGWNIEGQLRFPADVPQTDMDLAEELCAGELMALALGRLHQAKEKHDELESVYMAHMDFPALTEFTRRETERIFGV